MKSLLILFSLFVFVQPSYAKDSQAIFAGGCFWCMESPFEKIPGVKTVVSGYTGGSLKNPTYKQVSSGNSGHVEAVLITFDEKKVSYNHLLEVFWRQVDPCLLYTSPSPRD